MPRLSTSSAPTARPRRWRTLLAAASVSATVLAGAVAAPSAQAGLDIRSFSAPMLDVSSNEVTQAGGHPFVVENYIDIDSTPDLTVSGALKEAVVDMPVGFVGDPSDFPTCNAEELAQLACPIDSQIGTFDVEFVMMPGFPIEQGLYNMEVPEGQPARFGSPVMYGAALVYFDAQVRPEDNGIRVVAKDVSQLIPIMNTRMRLWGVPADPAHDPLRGSAMNPGPHSSGMAPQPLLTTATACGQPQVTRLRASSWEAPDVYVEREFVGASLSGCEDLEYQPTVKAQPDHTIAGQPAGYTVELTQRLNDAPTALAAAHTKDATVALPEGVTINPGVADGLAACSESEFGLGRAGNATCPESSKIGEITVETPMLDEPLTGGVYQAEQDANPFGSTLAIYLQPKSDRYGVTMKLAGEIKTDPATGRVTTVFRDNPQQPWSKMTLKLKGGNRGVLLNPATCGTKTTDWTLSSWARPGAPTVGTDAFSIDRAPAGGSCGGDLFAPSFTAGSVQPVAGASTPFSMTFGLPEGHQNLSTVTAALPAGLLGKVGSLPLCPEAQANLGACDPASRVGDVVAAVGGAAAPLVVPRPGGRATSVFMSGPYRGAPYSLSLVVPAQAGPLDLGTVVARAALYVDADDAHITAKLVESRVIDRDGQVVQTIDGGMPQFVDGVPMPYRSITVNMNREGFMVNPTSCAPKQVDAAIGSVSGTVVQRSARFQVGECAGLPLDPSLGITFTGGTELKRGKHPGIEANLGTIAGNANLKRVRATLPLAVALDPNNAKALCEPADAPLGECPEGSIIGDATATTPLLSGPVSGPVYFVKGFRTGANGQQIATLPKLYMALSGQGVKINVWADTSVSGPVGKQHLVTTFVNVPDVPINDFRLRVNSGSNGVLKATADVCGATKTTGIEFIGHNNVVRRTAIRASASGCRAQIVSASTTKTAVSVRVGGIGAGRLTLSGPRVRTVQRTIRASDAATLKAGLRLSTAQKLRLTQGRSVRVAVRVRYRPAKGKTVTLRRNVTIAGVKRN